MTKSLPRMPDGTSKGISPFHLYKLYSLGPKIRGQYEITPGLFVEVPAWSCSAPDLHGCKSLANFGIGQQDNVTVYAESLDG